MASPLLIQILPHVVLPSEMPAAWEMVHFLKLIHAFQSLEVCTTDIKVNIPFVTFIILLKAIIFQRIHYAFVF